MSKHQIQHGCGENEQADAGRDGRTRLERPNSQEARMGLFPYSADHEQDWQPYSFVFHTLPKRADHTNGKPKIKV